MKREKRITEKIFLPTILILQWSFHRLYHIHRRLSSLACIPLNRLERRVLHLPIPFHEIGRMQHAFHGQAISLAQISMGLPQQKDTLYNSRLTRYPRCCGRRVHHLWKICRLPHASARRELDLSARSGSGTAQRGGKQLSWHNRLANRSSPWGAKRYRRLHRTSKRQSGRESSDLCVHHRCQLSVSGLSYGLVSGIGGTPGLRLS